VSRLPSGIHLLAAPPDPAVMAQTTPELYGELLTFLRRFYGVILLDLGTGVTDPIATVAVDHADQVVVVTTPQWITNTRSRWRSATCGSSGPRLSSTRSTAGRRSARPSASSAAIGSPGGSGAGRHPAQDHARLRHLLPVGPRAVHASAHQTARLTVGIQLA
jgi:hypothetical protein